MPVSSNTGVRRASSLDLWARAAHDLRQPIQSLLLLTAVLADSQDEAARRQTAQFMEDALIDLQGLLDDLGKFARLEAGIEKPIQAPCLLPEIAAQVAGKLTGIMAGQNVALRITVAPISVTSDASWLKTMLTGLVLNALNFGAGNEILIRNRRSGNRDRIEIAFKGPAISSTQQGLAFVELRSSGRQTMLGRPFAGLGLIRQIASVLGCAIESTSSSPDDQRLVLVLPSGVVREGAS